MCLARSGARAPADEWYRARVGFATFELACVVIVVLTLVTMTRVRPARAVLSEYAALAVAGFVGEQTCISAYRFYRYAPGWHGRLFDVPVLVPLIWPLVILSARDVVSALAPTLSAPGRSPFPRAIAVALLVAFDASLVEVVAVRAGLWSWAEPGHLGVPVIGIVGWGYFAAGAEIALSRGRPSLAVVLGPVAAHATILATWWGFFRWTVRGDLGAASLVAIALIGLLSAAFAIRARVAGRVMTLDTAAPRMIAATLFVALLATTAPHDRALWTHTFAVAIPYLCVTALRRRVEAPPPLVTEAR